MVDLLSLQGEFGRYANRHYRRCPISGKTCRLVRTEGEGRQRRASQTFCVTPSA